MQSLIGIEVGGGEGIILPSHYGRSVALMSETFFSARVGGGGAGKGGRGMGVWRVEELEGHKCYDFFGYTEVCMYYVRSRSKVSKFWETRLEVSVETRSLAHNS